MSTEPPSFDELLDLLRIRLGAADDLDPSSAHSFKKLIADRADAGVIPENFYQRAFDELEAMNHLDHRASRLGDDRDAFGRLSAYGRRYLTSVAWPDEDAPIEE